LIWLLFDSAITGPGVLLSRLAGIALNRVGGGLLAEPQPALRPFFGMLTYNLLAMYLVYGGLTVERGFCYGQELPLTQGFPSFLFGRAGRNEEHQGSTHTTALALS